MSWDGFTAALFTDFWFYLNDDETWIEKIKYPYTQNFEKNLSFVCFTTLLPLPNNFFFKFGIISFLRRFVKKRLQKRLLKIFSRKERYEKGKNNLWLADL